MQTAVLSVMYLTAIGYVMIFSGLIMAADDVTLAGFDIEFNTFGFFFAGGLITTVFWVC